MKSPASRHTPQTRSYSSASPIDEAVEVPVKVVPIDLDAMLARVGERQAEAATEGEAEGGPRPAPTPSAERTGRDDDTSRLPLLDAPCWGDCPDTLPLGLLPLGMASPAAVVLRDLGDTSTICCPPFSISVAMENVRWNSAVPREERMS